MITILKTPVILLALAIASLAILPPASAAFPAIAAILELPRTEPKHYVDAVLSLIDLDESELAKPIAAEFAALELSNDEQIKLLDQVGTARLTRMARLMPTTASLVAKSLKTANQAQNDPDKINQVLADIALGTHEEQMAGFRAIRQTGPLGVSLCLDAISVAENPKAEARLREALVVLEPASVPMLIAATADESKAVRTQAAYALGRLAQLGRLNSPLAASLLAKGALFDPTDSAYSGAARWSYNQLTGKPVQLGDAQQLITQMMKEMETGHPPFQVDELGMIVWRANRDRPAKPYDARTVAIALASRLASDRLAFSPLDTKLRRHALLLSLEAGELASSNQPQFDEFTSSEVSDCLAASLSQSLPNAAIACCNLLGERHDSSMLYSTNGRPSPLAQAVSAAHPSVRFAAMGAIMKIAPQQPYAGSSQFTKTLIYFASATGEKLVGIASPQIARAAEMGSYLVSEGYRSKPFNQGSKLVQLVESTPDVEVILLDVDILLPNVRETLYRLRGIAGGGGIPVVLIAGEGRLQTAATIAEEHRAAGSMVIATSRPTTAEATTTLVARLTKLSTHQTVSESRSEQAKQARQWIQTLLTEGPDFYRLKNHHQALELMHGDASDLSTNKVLSQIGSSSSQVELVSRVSQLSLSIEARQSAAKAFQESVSRHGILLTKEQILTQYDRYNASESANEATQNVLGSLLDVIEGKSTELDTNADLLTEPNVIIPTESLTNPFLSE